MCVCVCACVCVYIYIYIHTRINTQIYMCHTVAVTPSHIVAANAGDSRVGTISQKYAHSDKCTKQISFLRSSYTSAGDSPRGTIPQKSAHCYLYYAN